MAVKIDDFIKKIIRLYLGYMQILYYNQLINILDRLLALHLTITIIILLELNLDHYIINWIFLNQIDFINNNHIIYRSRHSC